MWRLVMGLLAVGAAGSVASAKTITVDGDPSDWTGLAPALVHSVQVDAEEWIYKGEAGDCRTDPNAAALSNYDLTEVRVAHDNDWLYFLFRYDDITQIHEVSVCVGFDTDMSLSDSNGLNFLGDDSGVGLAGGAENHPEYIIQFHNAQPGITWPEFFHDAGAGTWYTLLSGPDFADADVFISSASDVVEAQVRLSAVGLTTASTFNLKVVTLDNGSSLDPSGEAFAEDTDTTVDYPGHDAIDGMGGTAGTTENAYSRVFEPPIPAGDPGPYLARNIPSIALPFTAQVTEWLVLE